MKTPRKLKEEEISVKVASATADSVELVLFVDRITIKNIMDETYGPFGWQSEHFSRTNGHGFTEMFCKVSVWDDENNRWISRDDCGSGTNDKNQSTDAFKRACVYFGVGTELYTVPESIICDAYRKKVDGNGTVITLNNTPATEEICHIIAKSDTEFFCNDSFKITQYILNDNGEIVALCIKNETTGRVVYSKDFRKTSVAPQKSVTTPASSDIEQYRLVIADCGSFKKNNQTLGELTEKELHWVFGHTGDRNVKIAILHIVNTIPAYKQFFLQSGINPDVLLKDFS